MDEEELRAQVKHLKEIEKLSLRQIEEKLRISRKKIKRLLGQNNPAPKAQADSIVAPYESLIKQWYNDYPFLQAIQVYERLKDYGYAGSYCPVKRFTKPLRNRRKREAFHEVRTLPGQECQVDWMQWEFSFGRAYGFVYILSYSRYLYARFYPRSSMEFLLDGHLEAFREIGGIAATHVYDNMKSIVTARKPEIVYNAQILDFARHYGFSVRACTPRRANEKGKVERVIQDIESFLRVNEFKDIAELNRKVSSWQVARNRRIHRTTGAAPADALAQERLRALPIISYKPYRHETAKISKTAFIEFQTNRYSVPTSYVGMTADILVYPDRLEVVVDRKTIARHNRLFLEKQTVEHPANREKLLATSPHYKLQRINQLMTNMDQSLALFIRKSETDGQDPLRVSHDLFKLLKSIARETLISAVKTAIDKDICRTSYLQGLLSPSGYQDNPVNPQNPGLLHITYQGRPLNEYDALIGSVEPVPVPQQPTKPFGTEQEIHGEVPQRGISAETAQESPATDESVRDKKGEAA
jgi:transposase